MSTSMWSLGLTATVAAAAAGYHFFVCESSNCTTSVAGQGTSPDAMESTEPTGCCNFGIAFGESDEQVAFVAAACSLDADSLKERVTLTQGLIVNRAEEVVKLDNGYRLRFPADDDALLHDLTDWIITERGCCEFFRFALTIEPDEPLWFEINGPPESQQLMDAVMQPVLETSG